jgi:hypothetical protein
VLTFATHVPAERVPSLVHELSPTPSRVSLHEATRARELPVIPRIVRRQSVLDAASPLLALLVRAPGAVRRSGAGTMLVAGLALATLGTIAGLGVRSLSDSSSVAWSGGASVFDASVSERLLSRGPLAPRTERPTAPRIAPAVETPPAHAIVAPSRPPARAGAHAALAPLVKPVTPSRAPVVYARR